MAEEDFNYLEEGRRIAHAYLSKRGWAGEWRRTLNRELYPAVSREEFEEKERSVDRLEDDAEEIFSREFERWRHETGPHAKEVMRGMLEVLGPRRDLGFFAKRIVDRLKREFPPF